MKSEKPWMIYGANGFTGELITREAHRRGLKPVLAGRDKEKIPALARELGLPFKIFTVEVPSYILENLIDIELLLNCAGPFSATSEPLVEACLAARTHYFDITGEINVFETVRKSTMQARKRGVMLMPGIGFDIVPTDCLALSLTKFLPDANKLILAFDSEGRPSQGTIKTMFEGMQLGGWVREYGVLKEVSLAHKVRKIQFYHDTKTAVTIPWGDVSTAYYTTGIPNIEVYRAIQSSDVMLLRLLSLMKPLTKLESFRKKLLSKLAPDDSPGPDADERANTRCYLWGQTSNPSGETKEAHMITPNGYEMTVQAALGVMQYFMQHDTRKGVWTPAAALGEHFARTLPDVELILP